MRLLSFALTSGQLHSAITVLLLLTFITVRSFASQVLRGSTSTSSWECGPEAMTPPTTLGSDCSYM